MKDVTKMADTIAHNIEKISRFSKTNWKSIVVLLWMLLVTSTIMRQQQTLNAMSSHNQVANLRMAVDDVRYSVKNMEEQVEKMERTVSTMGGGISSVQTTVNRIHTQVRNQPDTE
jgi:wobble nucleotide-excising tRNase